MFLFVLGVSVHFDFWFLVLYNMGYYLLLISKLFVVRVLLSKVYCCSFVFFTVAWLYRFYAFQFIDICLHTFFFFIFFFFYFHLIVYYFFFSFFFLIIFFYCCLFHRKNFFTPLFKSRCEELVLIWTMITPIKVYPSLKGHIFFWHSKDLKSWLGVIYYIGLTRFI